MLTSWYFGAVGDILGKQTCCFDQTEMRKTVIILENSRGPS